MKKTDILLIGITILLLLPFFVFPPVFDAYKELNAAHGYLLSFVKFALLATLGEALGLRIRTGSYSKPGFGFIPRAMVWGFLGIVIKTAFVIFGEGAPMMLKTMGVVFPDANPADILRQSSFSWLKLFSAFSVSLTMNLLFAPVFMAFHRITDTHILHTGGTITGFFSRMPVGQYVKEINWQDFWDFVLKKTIPLFWIPAQTINFMLPEGYRVLVAAVYSVILGVLLSLAAMKQTRRA
ncbi:MAG: Mpv17/PMP22 family protein [Bacteroidales bacterium]